MCIELLINIWSFIFGIFIFLSSFIVRVELLYFLGYNVLDMFRFKLICGDVLKFYFIYRCIYCLYYGFINKWFLIIIFYNLYRKKKVEFIYIYSYRIIKYIFDRWEYLFWRGIDKN